MKKAFVLVGFSCIAFFIRGRQKTDLEMMDLRGNVSTLTETKLACPKLVCYSCIMRKPEDLAFVTAFTAHALDEQGNQVSCKYYNEEHHLIRESVCSYGASGVRLKTVQKGYDGAILKTIIYKYDPKGYPIGRDYYDEKDSLYMTLDLTTAYFSSKYAFQFDTTGFKMELASYNENGKLSYRRPGRDKRINDPLDSAAGIKFNYLGQKAQAIELGENGTPKKRTYYSYDLDCNLRSKYTKIYDEKGNLVHELNYDKDSAVTDETFYGYDQFDSHGNWHRQTKWIIDEDTEFLYPKIYISQREIEYYQ